MARQKNAFIKILEDDINRHENNLLNPLSTPQEKKEIILLKSELLKLHNEEWHKRTMGSFIRSCTKWMTESDQNPNFFKCIEAKRQLNNRTTGLMDVDNIITNNTQNVLKIAKVYYENLFSTKNIDNKKIKDYLNSVQLTNTLSDMEADMCDNEISVEECFFALLHNMKSNKTPGHDGIPIEFYKRFWPHIKKHLWTPINMDLNLKN